jgi:putative ABC transport system permease protein
VFTAIFAAGISGSVDKVIDDQFSRTALIVTHDDGFSPVAPEVAERLQGVEGVDVVSPMRFDQANVKGGGDSIGASGVDPSTVTALFQPELEQGGPDTFANLSDDQVLADEGWAKDHGFTLGETLEVTTPKGTVLEYELVGTYDNKLDVLGNIVVTNTSMTKDWNQPDDNFILVGGSGDPQDLEQAASQSLEEFPVAKAQTLAQFKDESADQVNQLLGLVFGLLALSVIVALLGIVNTLALAVHERTRELGLLRAVGMSKRQVRRMVRAESVITALIGAILGLVLGIVFAVIVSRPLAADGFVLTFPIVTLIVLTVLAAVAGVLAAIPPARRASQVDVLRAVTTE